MKRQRSKTTSAADRALFLNLFTSIAEEMGVTLARTAYSPNIKERRDFSCAIFDPMCNMIAQAAHIPVHLGAMPMSVQPAVDVCGPLNRGDIIILNDPFQGGTHLPDITLVSGVYSGRRSKLVGYLASRAHHADIGGMTPGSLPLSREIFQEGLQLPPVHFYRDGELNDDLLSILLCNVRTPDERRGDLLAQVAAHRVGEERLQDAAAYHGRKTLHVHMQTLLDYGEQLMRSLIQDLPDGSYDFEDELDDDGQGNTKLPIQVQLTVRGDNVGLDFTGTAPACAGNLNAVAAITHSAVYYCFLSLLATPRGASAEAVIDPPLNSGCFRPIHLRIPDGSLLNAPARSAVAGGNVETSQRIVDVVFGALSKALPGAIPAASQGTMNNVTLGGYDPIRSKPFAYYETIGGGMGARPAVNGVDAVQSHMTNTLNTPIEALEFAYPFRVLRYEIVNMTGGRGRTSGGNGLRRDLQAMCDMRGAVLSERRVSQPYGLDGGQAGQPGKNRIHSDGRTRSIPAKCEVELQAGDILSLQTPGGGGLGRPPRKSKSKK